MNTLTSCPRCQHAWAGLELQVQRCEQCLYMVLPPPPIVEDNTSLMAGQWPDNSAEMGSF